MATGGMSLSKEFFEFLKAIGESKSKQEEDRIVLREMQRLKSKLEPVPSGATHPLSSKKKAKEFLVRILYVEMLGHDASFGYIKAVELAASASLYHKRTGYLVCGACLPPTHEFRFMLVNQMQRDLTSTNVLECSGGVLACTNIITADMVPAVATEVQKLLSHDSATIRKKSIVCYHRFHQLDDMTVTVEHLQEALRKSLCDKEPSVMGASLSVIEAMIRNAIRTNSSLQAQKDLVPSLVSILKQIGEHRLPGDYEYHRVPAPWMQIKLIRILGLLGQADTQASQQMYEVLHQTLKQADAGINAGYAIIYECCLTIVKIYPNNTLLDAAAESISRFITSRSNNVKYLGITALSQMVEQHPKYAAQHQLAVLDCLEDTDDTLVRKTLDLLYRMCNPVNVEFIAAKLIEFITDSNSTDLFLKKVLTTRVCTIAEKYAPNNSWYISTILHLCQVAGDWVDTKVAQNLMSLLAEGTGESEEADLQLRQSAIAIYVDLLNQADVATLPSVLIETMAWSLGEYAYLSETTSVSSVLEELCLLAKNYKTLHNTEGASASQKRTRHSIVSSILKLVAQAGHVPPMAATTIDEYTCSTDAELAMQCLEFQAMLTQSPHMLPHVFPVDASAEDVDVDRNLSFLDAYVSEAVHSGRAQPYQKPEDDDDDDDYNYGGTGGGSSAAFNLTPYEKPTKPTGNPMMLSGVGSGAANPTQNMSLPPGAGGGAVAADSTLPVGGEAAPGGVGLNTRNVQNVWGKGGLNTGGAAPAAAAAPAAPAAPDPQASKPNAWEQLNATSAAPVAATAASSSYGTPTPAPAPAEKTEAQLEKERMAAALFGGITPGSDVTRPAAGTTPSFIKPRAATRAPAARPPAPAPAQAAPAPPPAPAPAPDIDLLDMSGWDAPAAEPAPAPPTNFDVLGAEPAAAPAVETVSSEEEPPAATAPAPAVLDPFAGAGLLDSVEDKPLSGLAAAPTKFEYNGAAMSPLAINTGQFGQQWGSCPGTSNGSVQSSSINSLDSFMQKMQSSVGTHPVEAIAATLEGICAGSVGASNVCLVHAKLTPAGGGMRVDFTVKSTDASIASSLAMHLQTMLR